MDQVFQLHKAHFSGTDLLFQQSRLRRLLSANTLLEVSESITLDIYV